MNDKLKALGVGLAMLTVVGTGATMGHSAFAQDATPAATATAGDDSTDKSADTDADKDMNGPRGGMRDGRGGPMHGGGMSGFHVSMDDVATFLGITTDELQTEAQSGSSLADIAIAHGKTRDELKAFLVEQFEANLDAIIDDTHDAPLADDSDSDGTGGTTEEATPDATPAASTGITI